MTNIELNKKLYEKMKEEFQNYHDWIITLPSEEVLNHACEYIVKEDVLYSMEYNKLNDRQATAMLKMEAPLNDVYLKWSSWDTGYLQDIWFAVESRADELVRREQQKEKER